MADFSRRYCLDNITSSRLDMYANETTIYSCVNDKSDWFELIKMAAEPKNDRQAVVNWDKKMAC